MAKRLTPEERIAKQRYDHVTFVGNLVAKSRDEGFFADMKHDRKRWTVVELTRHGLTNTQISDTTGFSMAFVNDSIKDFAHDALVTAVKEGVANGSA